MVPYGTLLRPVGRCGRRPALFLFVKEKGARSAPFFLDLGNIKRKTLEGPGGHHRLFPAILPVSIWKHLAKYAMAEVLTTPGRTTAGPGDPSCGRYGERLAGNWKLEPHGIRKFPKPKFRFLRFFLMKIVCP